MNSSAAQFKAELWTTVSGGMGCHEVWAVVMLNGKEAGSPCAFGPKQKMEEYAASLNSKQGVIEGLEGSKD